MLLRRITDHVKTQNWTAVVLDFLIVVLGVFIGIQVANWNEARATFSKSEMFTKRLMDDLREEAWIYQYFIAYHEDVLKSAERAQGGLAGDSDQTNEDLLINAYRASQYTWWNRRRSAFDELIATGDLSLIKDDNLRSTALAVYASPLRLDIEAAGKQSHYRESFRMTIPTDIHRAIMNACGDTEVKVGDYEILSSVLSYDCALDLPPAEIDAAAQALRENAALAPALRLRIATLETQLADLHENNEVTAFFETFRKD